MNVLEVEKLSVENKDGTKLLDNINLSLKPEAVNMIVGGSGNGKSLLVSALVGFVPESLKLSCDDIQFRDARVPSLKAHLGKEVGFIQQDYAHAFNRHQTLGKQMVNIYRHHKHVSKKFAYDKVVTALKWVGLEDVDVMKCYRFMLSGGQLERVYIASILMLEPELIIADEPTASLDTITSMKIIDLIQHLAEVHEVTLLIITHDLAHVEKYADYINVIKDGRIIDRFEHHALTSDARHEYTKEMFS
ncbi:ATP-binding cassette domain-containing protein [Staphylococcus massiliensis]|uniref:ATP-binding cassette domain-containing protein n=1 Tax=Staphylococcus massiliensis TaxID=555791 RepID=UPI001EDD8EC3|nr:ATP-binding cassette domain-containing protein [Staphylococcus massiliensis]MCG3411700.1 ATP-binding cassette domain-containing protein [Staphylococcus massiliensis]